MNRIIQRISELSLSGKKAYIPFLTAGYPDIDATEKLVNVLEKSGADIIELGIPFSDPLADGPTIQNSSHLALQNGITPEKVFDCIKRIRRKSEIPLLIFAYTNIILQYGIDKFFQKCSKAGIDGVLVPDLSIAEADEYKKFSKQKDICMVFLVSPTTSADRMKKIEKYSDGFVYCVSVAGVTGARKSLFDDISTYLDRVESILDKPFMVGFGISSSKDAERISEKCDGIIIGSAILNLIRDSKNISETIKAVGDFSKEICAGLGK